MTQDKLEMVASDATAERVKALTEVAVAAMLDDAVDEGSEFVSAEPLIHAALATAAIFAARSVREGDDLQEVGARMGRHIAEYLAYYIENPVMPEASESDVHQI